MEEAGGLSGWQSNENERLAHLHEWMGCKRSGRRDVEDEAEVGRRDLVMFGKR